VVKAVDWLGLNTHPYYAGQYPLVVYAGGEQIAAAVSLSACLERTGVDKPVYVTGTGHPDARPNSTSGSSTAIPTLEKNASIRQGG
jgi:exo-beta-1,3-glucanase (GH17 family)